MATENEIKQQQAQTQAENIKDQQKAKADDLKKSLEDKQNFLKEQTKVDPSSAKKAIIGIVLPLLVKFINAEKSANAVINQLINTTKRKLKDKGRVEVNNGAIVFTPKNPGDYQRFKQDFEKKVNNLKKIVKILKSITDTLLIILKTLKAALLALKVQLALQKKILQAQAAAATADLAGPLPTKPAAAAYTASDRVNEDVIKPLEKKIDDYILMIGIVQTVLQIFQKMINSIKIKLDTLSLTINQGDSSFQTLPKLDSVVDNNQTISEYNNGSKTFTIEIITTSSGALQAVAFDSFSKMKITQTAPSKTRKADELINELKLILG
jgi:hypothetical protein